MPPPQRKRTFWFASSPLLLSAVGKTNLKDRHYRLTRSIFIFAALGFLAHLAVAVRVVLDEAQRGETAQIKMTLVGLTFHLSLGIR